MSYQQLRDFRQAVTKGESRGKSRTPPTAQWSIIFIGLCCEHANLLKWFANFWPSIAQKCVWWPGSARTHWGAYSAPQTFRGRGRERREGREEGKGEGRKGRAGKWKGMRRDGTTLIIKLVTGLLGDTFYWRAMYMHTYVKLTMFGPVMITKFLSFDANWNEQNTSELLSHGNCSVIYYLFISQFYCVLCTGPVFCLRPVIKLFVATDWSN